MENANYKELYHRALTNPMAIDGATLSTLIDRFPYAQALRAAQVLKNHHDDDGTLLVTGLRNWIYEVGEPPVEAEIEAEAATDHSACDIETVIPDIDDSGLMEHPVGMDYFAYEEKAADEAGTSAAEMSQEIVPLSEATPYEKVSIYNDDHLPYSFLWWLNKTRMEHADTYRPYAPEDEPALYPADRLKAPDEEQVLDHQIRENIFHLQSPEDKLSTPQPPETVPFQVPKKTDPIIERFIREEPQIKPPQADKINLENKARKSAEDQLTLVTETLANIYAEQALYPKAIAIYKKLSLKYPEKSAYFAARITELSNKLP